MKVNELPDGLAQNKIKVFQVDFQEEGYIAHVIFEYYTEYGTEGMVKVHGFTEPEAGMEFATLPVKALLAFVDHFRIEALEGYMGLTITDWLREIFSIKDTKMLSDTVDVFSDREDFPCLS